MQTPDVVVSQEVLNRVRALQELRHRNPEEYHKMLIDMHKLLKGFNDQLGAFVNVLRENEK